MNGKPPQRGIELHVELPLHSDASVRRPREFLGGVKCPRLLQVGVRLLRRNHGASQQPHDGGEYRRATALSNRHGAM
jgi:hypothetical protein